MIEEKDLKFHFFVIATLISTTFMIWTAFKQMQLVFPVLFGALTWLTYTLAHYVETGKVIDGVNGLDHSLGEENLEFFIGILMMITSFIVGILAVKADSIIAMGGAQILIGYGYIISHKQITEHRL